MILAAGKGTRMGRGEPKAAVPVNGRPMVVRVMDAVRKAGATRIIAVVGHRAEAVKAVIGEGVEYVVQEEQLGTGHAARCAEGLLACFRGPVIVAHADIPLLRDSDVARLVQRHRRTGAAATLLTALFDDPGSLGRILRGPEGRVLGIVEARDASEEQLKIREINVAVYCFNAPLVFEALREVTSDNAQGQYYLTDVIGILVARGESVKAVTMEVAHAGLGVDTVEDLARAQELSATHDRPS